MSIIDDIFIGETDESLEDALWDILFGDTIVDDIFGGDDTESNETAEAPPPSPVIPADDWAQVRKLKNGAKVKPYDIEVLATSKVPQNIPYLEVYRTDELYYVPYKSPYLSVGVDGSVSTSGLDGEGVSESGGNLWTELSEVVWEFYPRSTNKNYWIGELRDADANWTSIARTVNKMGGDKEKQNKVIQKVLNIKKAHPTSSSSGGSTYSSKTRNQKLKDELLKIISKYFKQEADYSKIANKYMQVRSDKVQGVTATYGKYLKDIHSTPNVNSEVFQVKLKYSK